MSKYIIKNCENLTYCPSCKEYECSLCLQGEDFRRKCSDNLDCLLKQIVEKVRTVAYAGHCDNCDGCGYDNGCEDTECGTYQANEILQLMELEEVE